MPRNLTAVCLCCGQPIKRHVAWKEWRHVDGVLLHCFKDGVYAEKDVATPRPGTIRR